MQTTSATTATTRRVNYAFALTLLSLPATVAAQEDARGSGSATLEASASAGAQTPTSPQAEPLSEAVHYPRVGGHIGLGVPFLTVGTRGTNFIGSDHLAFGLVGGINVALTPQLSFDFESIALGDFSSAATIGSATTFVFDPGVIYNWGPLWTGLRLAMRIPAPLGGAELGVVPIVGKAFKIGRHLSYYVELDLPMFVHTPGAFSFTTFVQTGIGF